MQWIIMAELFFIEETEKKCFLTQQEQLDTLTDEWLVMLVYFEL